MLSPFNLGPRDFLGLFYKKIKIFFFQFPPPTFGLRGTGFHNLF